MPLFNPLSVQIALQISFCQLIRTEIPELIRSGCSSADKEFFRFDDPVEVTA